jgi:hypothetical protein
MQPETKLFVQCVHGCATPLTIVLSKDGGQLIAYHDAPEESPGPVIPVLPLLPVVPKRRMGFGVA